MVERVRLIGDPRRPIRVVEDPALVEQPDLAFFLDKWRQQKGGALVPPRNSFVPREYGSWLQWLVLAEALPDCVDFRYRLIGSRVTTYFGGDSTGKTVRPSFAYNEMFCPAYDSLCLPYSSDGQGCDLVLEMFVFSPQRLAGSRDVRRLDVE